MSAHEPRRLLDYGGELRGLLRDALDAERADDAVDPARMSGIEQRIAASVGAAAAATAAPHPAPAQPAAAAPAPAPAAASGSWLGVKAPWVFLASAAIVGLGALAYSRTDSAAPASNNLAPRAPSAFVPEKKPLEATGATAVDPSVPTLSPADLPSAPSLLAPSKAAPRIDAPSASAAEGEEIALLARAHDALHGQPATSLELCRQHEARYAGGHFAQEREAVAIEALVYLSRRDEAARRFTAFKTRYPTSSHRVHLESLFPASAQPAP